MSDMSHLRGTVGLALAMLAATAPSTATGEERALGPRPQVEQPFVVVLDPGHGGSNDGCRGFDGEVHEKDVTLAMAGQLAAELRARLPHVQIHLTRDDDRTMTLTASRKSHRCRPSALA